MGDITCPITLADRNISITFNSTARSVNVSVEPSYRSISAIVSLGRVGEKGDQGEPGGLAAISAGSMSTSGSSFVFADSHGVSFGLNSNTLTASVAAQSQSIQTQGSVAILGSTGNISFVNSNGITFGGSGSVITASYDVAAGGAAVDHTHGGVPTLALTNLFGTASSASNGLTLSLSANLTTGTGTGASADGYNIIGVNGSTVHSAATIQFSDSNNISFGIAGSTITASAAQSAFVFSNGNGVLFGTNGSTVTASIIHPAQSAFVFSNSNGVSFGTTGSTVTASHNAMVSDAGSRFMSTVERGNYFYTSANTFANSTHSHGNPTLNLTNISGSTSSGSNGLTLNLSAPDGVEGAAFSAGTQTANTGTIVFSNSNGVSFGMSGYSRITASYDGLTTAALSNHSHGNPILNLTNISGTTASGSSGLTLSLSAVPAMNTSERGNYLYSSAYSSHTHGAISVDGLSATSNSSGLTLSFVQSVQTQSRVSVQGSSGSISFANSNGITFGGNASTITASHDGLTTAALSNHSHGNPSLQLTNLSGTASSNSAGATFSLSVLPGAPTLALTNVWGTTSTNSAGVSLSLSVINPMRTSERGNYFYTSANTFANSTHSHGNPTLALTNISGTTASASNGLTISLSAATAGAGGGVAVSAGTQSVSTGTMVFSNSNGITFGMSGSSRITASHNGLTTAAQVSHSHGNPTLALTNITGTTASASNGLTISLSAAAGGTGGGVAINAGSQSVNTGTILFVNSNGVSFGMSGSSQITASVNVGLTTAAQSNHSHGNPVLALTNLTGTTASGSNGFTISLSGGAGSGAGGVAINNSETTFSSGSVSLAASGALTIGSGTGQRMLFSVPQTSSLVGQNLTLSTNGSTITLSVQPHTTVSTYIPYYPASTGAQTMGATGTSTASAWFFPISVIDPIIFNQIEQLMTCSYITSTVSGQQTITHAFGIYSNNAGTLSRISSSSYSLAMTVTSVTATLSYPNSYGTAAGYGYGTTSASTTAQAHSLFGTAGNRIMTLGFGNTMSLSDGMYWIGFHQRMSSSSANVGLVPALAGNVMAAAQNAGPIGSYTVSYSDGSNATRFKWGWGVATSTGSAGYSGTNVPAAYPLSAIGNTATIMPMMTFISR